MDLIWVDEFIRNVRPYIFVREEDNLLIRMPNRAHRLNPQGVRILKFLIDGGTMDQLRRKLGNDSDRLADTGLFLHEIKRCLEGRLTEMNYSRAVEARPLTLGFSSLPILSEVAVTPRCNLRCAFCYYGCSGGKGAGNKQVMSTAEIERVLRRIHEDARVPSVSFTGGEPMLRKDLPHLVRHAKDIGFRVNLITNGTLMTQPLAELMATAGLDSAQVSLEGVTDSTHDAITGVRGSFEKSVAAVEHLRQTGITVHTNTTINRLNLGEIAGVPGFVSRRLGLERFSMNLVIPSGAAGVNEGILVRYEEVALPLQRVMEESGKAGVEFMWYSPTPLCMFNPIVHGLGNKGCSACDGLLSVDCNGDVLPCSSWPEPVGNMLASNFRDIWESTQACACRMKHLAHPGCRECDSFAVCHGACPLYWRHFGFSELLPFAGFDDEGAGGLAAAAGLEDGCRLHERTVVINQRM